jgi:2-desacetyl-2-hydroxyethyl bacteriochlorophyllide A dehydrogenase
MMKSVVCTEPGQMRIQEVSLPQVKPDHVLVRIKRIGICGTDLHAFSGNQPFFQYPRVLGHELSGYVESAPQKSDLVVGDTVYIIPYMACGNCVACKQAKPNCCTHIQVLGVHVDGGMCEYLQVPEQYVIKANNIDLDELAIVECLAIGAHAVRRSQTGVGKNVLVVGAGPIGMGIIQLAKASGAVISVLDTNEDRLEFCKKQLGADFVIKVDNDVITQLSELTNGDFYDSVFDATGNPTAMQAGFQYVAHAGNYILVSVVKGKISFVDPEFHKREMTLMGSRNATREDFEQVVKGIQSGKIKAQTMITHRADLLDLPELIAQWSLPQSGVIKAVVEV